LLRAGGKRRPAEFETHNYTEAYRDIVAFARGGRLLAPILGVSFAFLGLAAVLLQPASVRAEATAPDFSLTDIDGTPLNLTIFRGKLLLIDFMYINCASCEIARPVLEKVYDRHRDVMEALSIDIWPTDTDAALRTYRQEKGILWYIARDTDQVTQKYGVIEVVRLFLVSQRGVVIWQKTGMALQDQGPLETDLEAVIAAAVRGDVPGIDLQQVSIFALAALAGVASFFSPCSFPMLPGYMGFFLTLDSKTPGRITKRRAVLSGALSSLGIILVYGVIAAVLLATAGAAAALVPALMPAVGGLLIVMGAVMFTAVQYNWLVNPFRNLRQRVLPNWTPNEVRTVQAKLFSYGVGYGAAGFGCVAPPFIAAVLSATVLGGAGAGAAVLAVYAGVVVALMVAITLVLATVGQAAVKKMNRYTETIKRVSAAVLVVAGVYLIYFWYAAWVAS
jgi:cytochrome c-type biogenesis protein